MKRLPLCWPWVAGDRRQTGQAGGAVVFQAAGFRHFDKHGQRRQLADPGDADEDGEAGFQCGIGFAQLAQGRINGGDLARHLPQPLGSQALEQGRTQHLIAVQCRHLILHQGASRDQQFLHGGDRFTDHRTIRQLAERAEAGEHGGIDAIGFGTPADGLGEAACLQRA